MAFLLSSGQMYSQRVQSVSPADGSANMAFEQIDKHCSYSAHHVGAEYLKRFYLHINTPVPIIISGTEKKKKKCFFKNH